MRYYFAPMEGITDAPYRRVHHSFFPGLDAYYMPFISPTMHRTLTNRESRDLPMADSVPFRAVPQILTKVPEDFTWAAGQCLQRGYDEVNLNIGCPSGTVVSKGKGAGMLADPVRLDEFLDKVFENAPLPVSVKTRLGMMEAEEFPKILDILNQYPIKELTIHPRVRKQFYKGGVDMDMFRYALQNSKNPLCYNGNLRTLSEVRAFEQAFPQVEAVMIGRGLVGNPAMFHPEVDAAAIRAFHDALLETYIEAFGSARNAIFRLKENWHCMSLLFEGSEKLWKKLRKTTDIAEYRAITAEIFATLPMHKELQADW
ncbi:MAG: tRNA-dihydrouridine synthase family protein [Oscillospiraceae bacterium]|nr:tRNA-dihydrouridine synthase family protein [Oscillospiraceae bacterium]